jgi:hypothetical protein
MRCEARRGAHDVKSTNQSKEPKTLNLLKTLHRLVNPMHRVQKAESRAGRDVLCAAYELNRQLRRGVSESFSSSRGAIERSALRKRQEQAYIYQSSQLDGGGVGLDLSLCRVRAFSPDPGQANAPSSP